MRKQVLLTVPLAAALIVATVAWAAGTAVLSSGNGSSWPSTYFNGPLGGNEVLPATHGHTLMSLWVGTVGDTASQERSLVQQRITDMGRSPDLIGFQCDSRCSPRSGTFDTAPGARSRVIVRITGGQPLCSLDGHRARPCARKYKLRRRQSLSLRTRARGARAGVYATSSRRVIAVTALGPLCSVDRHRARPCRRNYGLRPPHTLTLRARATSSSDLSENWIHSKGAVSFVTWSPGGSYAQIAAGSADSEINAAASRFKAFGHRIMVRMFEEFDLHSWNTQDFISAWRHVVVRMQSDGATNVGFVWCPTEEAGGLRRKINASYPGDAYVDWVSSDSYNGDSNTVYSATVPGWNEFSWIFNYHLTGYPSMEQQWGPEKPYFVSETSSKYDTADVPSGHTVDPNRKEHWFINIESAAANMPYLVGVQFFDADVHALEPGNNWRVDSPCDSAGTNCTNGSTDANTYSGFLSMADSSQFSGGVAGGNR